MINRLYKIFVYDNDEVLMIVDYNVIIKIYRQVVKMLYFIECFEILVLRYFLDCFG